MLGGAAQHRVDPVNSYYRVVAVVPLVGAGTYADPRRPMYVPTGPRVAGDRSGIIAFSQQITDDKKSAVVEFVAADRAALLPILNDASLKVFEKGKHLRIDIELEVKKAKKGFTLDSLSVPVR